MACLPAFAVAAQPAGHQHPAAARVQDGGGGALPVGAQPLRRGQDVLGHPRPPRHHLRRHRRPAQRRLPRAREELCNGCMGFTGFTRSASLGLRTSRGIKNNTMLVQHNEFNKPSEDWGKYP